MHLGHFNFKNMHTHTHRHKLTHTRTRTLTHEHTQKHIYAHSRTHTRSRTNIHRNTLAHITHTYARSRTNIHRNTHTHTHTHTHAYICKHTYVQLHFVPHVFGSIWSQIFPNLRAAAAAVWLYDFAVILWPVALLWPQFCAPSLVWYFAGPFCPRGAHRCLAAASRGETAEADNNGARATGAVVCFRTMGRHACSFAWTSHLKYCTLVFTPLLGTESVAPFVVAWTNVLPPALMFLSCSMNLRFGNQDLVTKPTHENVLACYSRAL